MWIARFVGVGVVLAMVGHPVRNGALDRGRAENGEDASDQWVSLEAAVGEQPVVAGRDAEPAQGVEDSEDAAVGARRPKPMPSERRREQGGRPEHEQRGEN